MQVYQMVVVLTRSHGGSVSFRTWSGERRIRNSDRPVNSGFATPLPHHADALHRHWFRRQAIFLLLLTLHKLFLMQRFLLLLLLSLVCTIFCAQVNDLGWAVLSSRRTDIPRHLGWMGGFVKTSLTHARDFGITLPARIDRAMSPLRNAELFAPPPRDRLGGWNLVPHQARTTSLIPNTLTS